MVLFLFTPQAVQLILERNALSPETSIKMFGGIFFMFCLNTGDSCLWPGVTFCARTPLFQQQPMKWCLIKSFFLLF